uniref:Uncharacterized protein n=1 Tax=Solanum tuberosum TaxID=4113 RepID=M1DPC2_SOLTU
MCTSWASCGFSRRAAWVLDGMHGLCVLHRWAPQKHAGDVCGATECYLVDPASSHMVVSNIKPCMCKYKQIHTVKLRMAHSISYSLFDGIYYSDIHSNSRANMCKKPRHMEGIHLLDKRSTRDLPIIAIIHDNSTDRKTIVTVTHHSNFYPINKEGRRRTTAKAFAKDVFINQERKLGARRRSDTVLVSTINDADQGSAVVAFRTPSAPYEKSKFSGFLRGGGMHVAPEAIRPRALLLGRQTSGHPPHAARHTTWQNLASRAPRARCWPKYESTSTDIAASGD